MMKKNKQKSEFSLFDNLSSEWWAQNGKFKILHDIAPIRIRYIKNKIQKSFKIDKNLNKIKILDLGCGGGLVCEPLARLGAQVTGIDFVKSNIEVAKNHSKKSGLKINYLTQDLKNLKIKNKFDVILLLEVIEHIEDWDEIIIKCSKNLNKGGIIILSTINRTILSKFLAIYVSEKILKWTPKNTHSFSKLVKPIELITFLEKNHFQEIDITGLAYNPLIRNWILSKNKTKINYFCSAKKIN